MRYTMKHIPLSEQPHARAEVVGTEALSDAELLAIILKTGTRGVTALELARNVLMWDETHPGLLGLCYASKEELCELPGIGPVKALQLISIAELAKRIANLRPEHDIRFGSSQTVANYFREQLQYESQECVYVVYLDTNCNLLKKEMVSKGTATASLITPREILIHALQCKAVYMIVIHNHPSGAISPSDCDREITLRIKDAGALVGVELIDHIIVGSQGYYSFSEHHSL